MNQVITIGCQCGSGGHTIGNIVAERLGIPFYDKEIIKKVAEHGVDPAEAKKHVLDRDKKRAKYYRHITDQIWGLAENYDLCLNSSKLGVDGCVDLIIKCCQL